MNSLYILSKILFPKPKECNSAKVMQEHYQSLKKEYGFAVHFL